MKNALTVLALLLPSLVFSQYYFTDIVDARVTGERMRNYVQQKVKKIVATGYDRAGAKSTDFNEWHDIDAATRVLRVTTRNGQEVKRETYQFDDQFRLTGITDSSGAIKSNTVYGYDRAGNLINVKTTTTDSLQDFSETIEHQYSYSSPGKPERLWRIVNGRDSSEYRFSLEGANVADEQLFRRGTGIDPIYYYYNDQNRITDIVRYDKKAKKLLPTDMFEYDDAGRVIQKTTVISSNNPDYLIWRYLFNEKGLKTKEALFNKQKELTGRIEYQYTFNP